MKRICILSLAILALLQTGCMSTMRSLTNSDVSRGCTGRTDWVVPTSQSTLSSNIYIEQVYVAHPENSCTAEVNMPAAVELAKEINVLTKNIFSSNPSAYHLAVALTLRPNLYTDVDVIPFMPLDKHNTLSVEKVRPDADAYALVNKIKELRLSPKSQITPGISRVNVIYWIGPIEKRTRLPE